MNRPAFAHRLDFANSPARRRQLYVRRPWGMVEADRRLVSSAVDRLQNGLSMRQPEWTVIALLRAGF